MHAVAPLGSGVNEEKGPRISEFWTKRRSTYTGQEFDTEPHQWVEVTKQTPRERRHLETSTKVDFGCIAAMKR